MTDYKKSLDSVISDRISSPFWGTLIISWLIWNWKVVVLLFFVSENKLPNKPGTTQVYNKVEYMLANYCSLTDILIFPLISTAIIIGLIPFLANGAFWLTLKFKKWRIDQKNTIEMNQVLTIKQSLELRREIKNQEKSFQEILEGQKSVIASNENLIISLNKETSEKTALIEQFKTQLDQINKTLSEKESENSMLKTANDRLDNESYQLRNSVSDLQKRNNAYEKQLTTIAEDHNKLNVDLREKTIEIQQLNSELLKFEKIKNKFIEEENIQTIVQKVLAQASLKSTFEEILYRIQKSRGSLTSDTVHPSYVAFFEGHGIIEQKEGRYSFTSRGKDFLKIYSEIGL